MSDMLDLIDLLAAIMLYYTVSIALHTAYPIPIRRLAQIPDSATDEARG